MPKLAVTVEYAGTGQSIASRRGSRARRLGVRLFDREAEARRQVATEAARDGARRAAEHVLEDRAKAEDAVASLQRISGTAVAFVVRCGRRVGIRAWVGGVGECGGEEAVGPFFGVAAGAGETRWTSG
jgi:hypothetical protein